MDEKVGKYCDERDHSDDLACYFGVFEEADE